ncbi:XapX domain-containing protein [Peptostreptococcaceae bacterium AGR-M142]
MKIAIISLFVGLITGLIFSFAKLPLPAPPTLPGVTGIFGIYAGSLLAAKIMEMMSK